MQALPSNFGFAQNQSKPILDQEWAFSYLVMLLKCKMMIDYSTTCELTVYGANWKKSNGEFLKKMAVLSCLFDKSVSPAR